MALNPKVWYRVSAPYVTVRTRLTDNGQPRIIGLGPHAPLPFDADPRSITHLASHGLVEEYPASESEQAAIRRAQGLPEPRQAPPKPPASEGEGGSEGEGEGGKEPAKTPAAKPAAGGAKR